jgi:hypothetical protein
MSVIFTTLTPANVKIFDGGHKFKVVEVNPANGAEVHWKQSVGGSAAFVVTKGAEYDPPKIAGIVDIGTGLEGHSANGSASTQIILNVDDGKL